MGNSSSSLTDSKLLNEINYIAANYITTQSFKDMEKLADLDYCNDLVIITSDVIAKSLNVFKCPLGSND